MTTQPGPGLVWRAGACGDWQFLVRGDLFMNFFLCDLETI